MKRIIKLTLVLLASSVLFGTVSASAQKFGYINSRDLMQSMPEVATIEKDLKALESELMEMLEAIQVEYNKKFEDYQKNLNTMSDSGRQLKEKELQDLGNRFNELQKTAGKEMEEKEAKMMTPVLEKARAAVKKVSEANGIVAVFDVTAGAMVYHNESMMVNVLPLVQKELGITPAK